MTDSDDEEEPMTEQRARLKEHECGGGYRLTQFCRHWQVVGGGVRVQTQRDVDQRLEQSDCHNGIQGGGGGV